MLKKKIAFIVLVALLVQYSIQTSPPNTTPSSWTEGAYSAACNAIGTPKIVQDSTSVIPLSSDNIYLKTSYNYAQWGIAGGKTSFTQSIFKYYIQLVNNDGIQTKLNIVQISGASGMSMSQSTTISNTYEFIDGNGPYVLLKQTDGSGNVFLNLYHYDGNPISNLVQLTTNPISTYPNQIFKYITLTNIGFAQGSIYSDASYNYIASVVSINTATTQTIVRKIIPSGINGQIYSFAMNNINSDIYINSLLGLQIIGSNFYTYVSPAHGSGSSPPFVYANDQTAITTAASLYSNHIVVPFIQSMMVATYDDTAQNANIFFLISDQTTYDLSLVNMKTTTATSNPLQYLTDYSSYIIELDADAGVNTFYIVWADTSNMLNYTFLNSFGDNNNAQIVNDFTNPSKISSFIYAQQNADNTYTSNLYLWIYSSNGITKYVLTAQVDASSNLQSITINKEFAVQLAENVLVNSAGPNFQITTQLKCVCQTAQVTEMICFYSSDACTFTVQTLPTYCTPSLG